MARKLLSLDYSTSATGFALFDLESKALEEHGVIKPTKTKGVKGLTGLQGTLARLKDMAAQIKSLIERVQPIVIIIEEVNRGCARISQKVLCGGHYILYQAIETVLDRVVMVDSDGSQGWRTNLGIRLTDSDKVYNAQVRRFNKRAARGEKKPEVTRKTLACRFANKVYGLQLDEHERTTDGDVADALGLAHSYLYSQGKPKP